MLKRFEVENYRGFSEKLVFDLTARDYGFNQNLICNGLVSKAIIYGKNGIGKSTFGFALFDIITHLTDNLSLHQDNYRNLNNLDKPAMFRYYFKFGTDEIIYEYFKFDYSDLQKEKLTLNGKTLIRFDYFSNNSDERFIDKDLKGSLNIELPDNKLSVLKYIYRNTPTSPTSPVTKLIRFCENMLWYRSLSDGNTYMGFKTGGAMLTEVIREYNKLDEFQCFLKENGLDYQLGFEMENGKYVLYSYYNNGQNKAPFYSVASTGTKALLLYYSWSILAFSKISFLFIDEFDAFLHYESSEKLVKMLNEQTGFQSVLTTHNTYLMQNRLTRPDCCFLMTQNKITNLYDATNREIREAHNLEKMYINGAFTE
ncbi:MAG: ATP/GTP-binding protein [Oscillospiraceae bacterium]